MNSNIRYRFASYTLASLLTLTLFGCGGESTDVEFDSELESPVAQGIDDDTLIDAPNGELPNDNSLLPSIDLGLRQFADSNVLLEIEAQVTAAEGAIIENTLWTQVSGPAVDIPSLKANTLLIVTPDVAVTRILEFRFTARDDQGRINSTTLPVVVQPLDSPINVIGGVFGETDLSADFDIRLSETSTSDFDVNYIVINGSAIAGEDFEFTSGNVTIPAGELVVSVSVPLLDDQLLEEDENFSLQAVASDGETSFANTGPAIIRNGIEPTLNQSIVFNEVGPVELGVGDTFTNTFAEGFEPLGSGDLLYMSSDPSIASVDELGNVLAINQGGTTITATKQFDNEYRSGEASYDVNVTLANEAPVISFVDDDGGAIESASIAGLRNPDINVGMTDLEDGQLPTAAQLAEFQSSGIPITSYSWESDIDGNLGNGHLFPNATLTAGHHIIRFSARDSNDREASEEIDLLVSNIAPLSSIFSSSEICEDPQNRINCFSPSNANDAVLDTAEGLTTSWAADVSLTEQTLSLSWDGEGARAVRISEIELYTTEGRPLRDFVIEGSDADNQTVTIATVNGNTDTMLRFPTVNLNVFSIRIRAISGPDDEPGIARINEVVIFGNQLLPQNMFFATLTPVQLDVGDTFVNTFELGSAPLGTGYLEYRSTDSTIASVDQDGNVTALSVGRATIIAAKMSDTEYDRGQASYNVTVSPVNTPPTVTFVDFMELPISSASIGGNSNPDINVLISDTEDGELPTAAQRAAFNATGTPIPGYRWETELNGVTSQLGDGHIFPSVTLARGHHTVRFFAEDSEGLESQAEIDLLVENIAPINTTVNATSEFCPDPLDPTSCYSASNTVDTSLNTTNAINQSWAADVSAGEQILNIVWLGNNVDVTGIKIYTTAGREIRDFVIEGINPFNGATVPIATVNGNTDAVMEFPLLNQSFQSIQIRAISGPDSEPGIARINEVVIFGQQALVTPRF